MGCEQQPRPSNNVRFKSKNSESIGLSLGGAKDVNHFRQCLEKNRMPSVKSITYNGLFSEYYFDTKTRKHIKDKLDDEKTKNDEGSMLFYPSYCYAKTRKLEVMKEKKHSNEYEYYMTVGLNSNLRMNEFKRKHLNLVIVLDKSGSMGSTFNADSGRSKSKMQVATESIVGLLKHLTSKDRFALITFETSAVTLHGFQFVNGINLDKLKESIVTIHQN